jgi:hypothetical protein
VPTNKQRRETARRHLERQLQRRVEREQRRRRVTLIASIAGTLVLIAVIIIAFVAFGGDDSKPKKIAAGGNKNTSASPSTTAASPSPTPSTSYPPAKGPAVSFKGVTVKGATDLKGIPGVTSKGSGDPSKLEVKDLVVGKGKAATPTSTVNVQYYGVLYKNGTYFDSSWKRGMPTSFPLTGVVPGFTQGIGGAKGIAPMKVGGRRIIIVPSAMGYGKQAQPGIPANSPLVFIVDLLSVK